MINHCPVTPYVIDAANNILSCYIPFVKGQTVRSPPPPLVSDYVVIQRQIKDIN